MQVHQVHQIEFQRLGGRCSKYPVSCLIRGMLSKHVDLKEIVVLDVTYGQGRFYGAWRPSLLIGADVKIWDWVVEPDIFIPKPVWELENYVLPWTGDVDLVVVDPPFYSRRKYRSRDMYSFYAGHPVIIINYAFRIANVLADDSRLWLLVHYKEPVKLKAKEIERIEFLPRSRYLNTKNTATYFQLFKIGDV